MAGVHDKSPNALPATHILLRLLLLHVDDEEVRSAPLTPKLGLFDFSMQPQAVTLLLLNVLLDPATFIEGKEELDVEEYQVIKRTVKDFKFGRELGEGLYSTVVLAADKLTGKQYAVKILDKRHIIKEKKVKYVNIEKHALNRLRSLPGIVSLFFTFQDKYLLYFVLDYAANGELLGLIKQYKTLSEECTRHFGAQILGAVRCMHDNGVIHRDIKPENILLDSKFRIQITDFGTAKLLEKAETEYPVDVRAHSFVGTAEYVLPELLESKYCGKPGDIWAVGCILYQMIAGKPPFKAANEYLTFQKITKLQYAFSAGFPLVLRDLIKKIFVVQPLRRATMEEVERHVFFKDVEWGDAVWTRPVPPLGPYKMSAQSMTKIPTVSTVQVKKRPEPARRSASDVVNGKGVNPASVAAYVLSKPEPDEPPPRPQPKTLASPEYIPGTNIKRPTINTMANFARTPPQKDERPRVLEVTPRTHVEEAWSKYLEQDERILNVGLAIVCTQPSEVFEKRHRGYIHAPLHSRTRQRDELGAEEEALRFHDDTPAPEAPAQTKFGKFRKFLLAKEEEPEPAPRRQSVLLERARTCTVVVTTFGRVLVFLRDDTNNDYKLILEVRTAYSFVHIKEVVSASKFSKFLPSTAIFALLLVQTTVVFEVEKFDLDQWTEALARGKINQHERERREEASLMESPAIASQALLPRESPLPRIRLPLLGGKFRLPRTPEPERREKKSKGLRRKPPPDIKKRDPEPETIHAAQLAVSKNPQSNKMEGHRSSSFARDGRSESPAPSPGSKAVSKVTPMNSKFLARTRGKK